MHKTSKKAEGLESSTIPEGISVEPYKENLTTGAQSIQFHDVLNVQVARPTQAKLKELADLIKLVKNIIPSDEIFIFSSDPNYDLFSDQENELVAI